MSDNGLENGQVGGWWAASTDAGHERISLYEKLGGRESLLDCITVTADEFPTFDDFKLEVKTQFGGGIYVAVTRGPNGTFGKRLEFAISGRPIRERADDPAVQQQPAQQSETALLLARLDENQRRSDERFAQLMETMRAQPAKDPLADIERIANILGKSGATPPPQKSLFEQLQEFKAGAELLGLGERGNEDESLLPILAELVGGIKEFATESEKTKQVEAAARARGNGLQVRPELPAATPAAAPSIEIEAGLLSLLGQLVTAAENGADVKVIARQILKKAEANPKHGENLKALLLREDALQLLQKFNPKVGEFFDWFESLANEILIGMGVVEDGGDSTGGEPASGKPDEVAAQPEAESATRRRGDKANAAPNARTRAPRKAAAGSKSASAGAG